jgi:hypothetical protein
LFVGPAVNVKWVTDRIVITLNRRQARHIQIPTAHRRPAGITLKGVEAEEVAAAAVAVAEEVPGIKIVVPVAAMGATKEVAEVTIKEAITTLAAEAEATAIAEVTEAAAVAVTEVAEIAGILIREA